MTMTTEQRDEIVAAVESADLCCPEFVCDAVLRIAEDCGDWQAELDLAIENDAEESEFLGIEGIEG